MGDPNKDPKICYSPYYRDPLKGYPELWENPLEPNSQILSPCLPDQENKEQEDGEASASAAAAAAARAAKLAAFADKTILAKRKKQTRRKVYQGPQLEPQILWKPDAGLLLRNLN